jgi:hypothetical protein
MSRGTRRQVTFLLPCFDSSGSPRPLTHWMKRIGDDEAGFSAQFDPDVGAVRVRGWGFWSSGVADVFARTVSEVCNASPRGAALFLDMTGLKPLREEGQRSFSALVGSLRELGVGRTAVATASHLTKLQLLRLTNERGAQDSVQFTTLGTDLAQEVVTVREATQKERTNR